MTEKSVLADAVQVPLGRRGQEIATATTKRRSNRACRVVAHRIDRGINQEAAKTRSYVFEDKIGAEVEEASSISIFAPEEEPRCF
jgi:hypothetical protein